MSEEIKSKNKVDDKLFDEYVHLFSLGGLFHCMHLVLVQKKQITIGDVKADGTQDYYYTMSFTNGTDIFSCTSGKFGDLLNVGSTYNLGFDYIDKKLKLVSYDLV